MRKYLGERIMIITDEEAKQVEELAAVFFTPKEISFIMEFDEAIVAECMNDEDSTFFKSFQKGRLQSEFDLRKSVVKLAKSGSSPAQTMAMDLLNKSKLKMLDR